MSGHLPIGTQVRLLEPTTHIFGRVVGYGVTQLREDGHGVDDTRPQWAYLVELKQGMFSLERDLYVKVITAHPDSVHVV